jgi:RiboL-PSP-HEPN
MATRAASAFSVGLGYARALDGLATYIESTTTSAVDVTDIYRAALVQAVSALDRYVHEAVRELMLETHRGRRAPTTAFQAFAIQMVNVAAALSVPTANDSWLEAEIVRQHSIRSFQKSDKIADAFKLGSPTKVWERLASATRTPAVDLRRRLDLIVDRRNQIVHEADADPSNPGSRWPISPGDISTSIDFIDRIVLSLDPML